MPGEILLIDDLSRKLDASKTPIREALNRLKGEGIIEDAGKGKIKVIKLSSKEISNICELRESLEVLALKWGFENISKDDIKNNLKILKRSEIDLKNGKTEYFKRADSELHDLIITSANNKWLTQIILKLRHLIEITRNLYVSIERYKISVGEHRSIVNAILNNNKKEAIKFLSAHLENVKTRLLESFNKNYLT